MIAFANKIYFFLLLFVPLLVWWHVYLGKKGKRHIFYSSKQLFRGADSSIKAILVKSLSYIKFIPLVLFIAALARPQILNYYSIENKKGIDILISLDISGSMSSIDFKPKNRLEVAKEVISDFIRKRETDRIGLVIFAGASYTRCPLTIDYDLLKLFLKDTSIGELEDGTAIGMALATSVNRIRHSKAGTKIIILLTDGVNNRGEMDPRDAAAMAKDFNIKVYTIGVGTRGRAPYPVKDAYGRVQHVMMNVEIDEKLLQEIANSTGGLYFRATDKDSLQQIFSEIDRWEKTEITTKKHHEAKDIFIYFILAGLLLLMLVEFARRTVLRTLP
ncbi:MAG: VWA domain-containing protein [Candidatus Aminicenantes bacterium]|nr:VWA domain-containing protein [Candidatus Aminicenantes bacterium]